MQMFTQTKQLSGKIERRWDGYTQSAYHVLAETGTAVDGTVMTVRHDLRPAAEQMAENLAILNQRREALGLASIMLQASKSYS